MLKRSVDLAFSILVLVASVYLWQVADRFPAFAKYRNVDSDFWPKFILVITGVLSAIILLENIAALHLAIRSKRHGSFGFESEAPAAAVDRKKMILMGLLCIAYYWGLSVTGFLIATIVFMWLAMAVIGGARKVTALVFPVVFAGALAIIFVKVLDLSLPRGVWLFHEFSLLLY